MNARIPELISGAQKLAVARELTRGVGLHDNAALLQALQNSLASCTFKNEFTQALDDLCCDLDSDVHYPPEESSIPATYSEPVELDAQTVRRVS